MSSRGVSFFGCVRKFIMGFGGRRVMEIFDGLRTIFGVIIRVPFWGCELMVSDENWV
jgi:hypothetical protein